MQSHPSVIDFTKLLNVIVKMKQYSVALHLFDEMRHRNAPINEYTLTIAINCYCRMKRVSFGFAIFGSFFKLGFALGISTLGTLISGLFLDHKAAEALKLFQKIVNPRMCEPFSL